MRSTAFGVTFSSLAASDPVTNGRDKNSSTNPGSFELLRHSLGWNKNCFHPPHRLGGCQRSLDRSLIMLVRDVTPERVDERRIRFLRGSVAVIVLEARHLAR
jgi:hypothetical protein